MNLVCSVVASACSISYYITLVVGLKLCCTCRPLFSTKASTNYKSQTKFN